MTWREAFNQGVDCYKRGNLEGALAHMNKAAELQDGTFTVYDSRAAVHEKLGNLKAALLDSKRTIELAPDRWQGYVRSARLFDLLGKYGSAIKMVDHAMTRLRPEDAQRHAQLLELRDKAVASQTANERERLSQVTRSSYLLGKLPVETLIEIFTLLVDQDHTWAVKLSHVCGHWRRILINTPSIWQTLVLSKKRPLQKAKLWKQRARSRIAHIFLDVSPLDTASIFAELKDLSWDNLSTLRISETAFSDLHHMLSGISNPYVFSKLNDLTLLGCKSSDPLSYCLSGPKWRLRSLHLAGLVHLKSEWWQHVQQLKELYLSGNVLRFSLSVFAANISLEKFAMIGSCTEIIDPIGDNVAPTSMDNLKCVKLQHFVNPFNVIRAITAPSITHFSMSTIATMADETLLHIASRPSLTQLRISNCSLTPSTILTLLSSASNLETLQINSVHSVVNEVFQFLTPKTIDSLHGLPCHTLKHLDVSHCPDLTTSSIYAFVKTRLQYASDSAGSAKGCAVLVSLNVDGCPKIEADMLPWFRSKVAQFSCIYATKKDFKDRRRHLQL